MNYRNLGNLFRQRYKHELDFLNIFFINPQDYDIIIGYRSDDSYFAYPLAFIRNELTIEKLEEIYLLGDLGKQIVFISEKAINMLQYVDSRIVEPIYKDKYLRRKNEANNKFYDLLNKNRFEKGDKIIDLIKKYDK